jgi:hypothetical protein
MYENEGDYGEEAEEIEFRGSGYAGGSNGFSKLDIIQENDDEQDGSISKSKSKSAHSSPPQTRSTGDKKESRKAEDIDEDHIPKEFNHSSESNGTQHQERN